MADDDTTPIALRKWLLRSSDNTTRLISTTKRAVLKRLVAFICAAGLAWHLCTFENAADLRFFGGIGLALDLWLAVHGAANATVLELPCDQISRVYDAQQPIIFRSCIPEGVGLADIGYFPDEKQNLFTPCEKKLIRDFEFVDVSNKSKAIVEQVPCAASTLRDKVAAFYAHSIRRHGNYFEVHTRMASADDGAPRSNVDLERGFLDDVRGLPLVEDRFRADRFVGRVRDEWRRHLIFTSARLALAYSDLQVSWFLDRTEGH